MAICLMVQLHMSTCWPCAATRCEEAKRTIILCRCRWKETEVIAPSLFFTRHSSIHFAMIPLKLWQ